MTIGEKFGKFVDASIDLGTKAAKTAADKATDGVKAVTEAATSDETQAAVAETAEKGRKLATDMMGFVLGSMKGVLNKVNEDEEPKKKAEVKPTASDDDTTKAGE